MLGLRSDPVFNPPLTLPPQGGMQLGVVAALPAEGRCLARRGIRPGTGLTLPGPLQLQLSGIGPERAHRTAADLVAAGARALVSWGVAGGIASPLSAGTLLLPDHVQASRVQAYWVDSSWRQRLADRIEGKLPFSGAPLYHAERILSTAGEKAALYRRTGCGGVDMESAAVGEVATRAGIPFLIIRAIADPAPATLPATALQALDAAGRLQWPTLIASLLRHPHDVLGLWQLARYFRAARTTLQAVAAQAGPTLLAPE